MTAVKSTSKTLSVLLIEDNEDHAALVMRSFRGRVDHGLTVKITLQDTMQTALEAIQNHDFDVIVSDLKLPDSPLEETLPTILGHAAHIPVVVLTSLNDSELGMKLVKQGAQDFLVKSAITGPLITRSVLYAIERKQHELQQKAHAEQLESLVTARTRHLQLLTAVADVSYQAHSIREALQQTVDAVCTSLEIPVGVAALLPEGDVASSIDIGVEYHATAESRATINSPEGRESLLQRAVDSQNVIVSETDAPFAIVVPVIAGKAVPAVLEFWRQQEPSDLDSLVSVMERIRTQIGRVFERDDLQRAIEEAAHLEQQSLIGELHDGLGHELSGLTWLAHSQVLKLEEEESSAVVTAGELHRGLRNSLTLLRKTLRGLTSLQLGAGGFIPAISSLLQEAQKRSSCRFELDSEVALLPLSEFKAAQIYRIIQESVTNITKHSGATHACVTIILKSQRLTVSVSDNGDGMSNARSVDSGLGFGIMRHRTRLIGGDLTIRESTAHGLQILLECPLQPRSEINSPE